MVITTANATLNTALSGLGYRLLGRCWEDALTITYEGRHLENGRTVFVRVLKSHRAGKAFGQALQRDYTFRNFIPSTGVPKSIAYERLQGIEFIITPDDDTRPLEEMLLERRPSLIDCLELLSRVCKILSEIHQANVVHRNINPSAIWFNPRSFDTCITDFSHATQGTELAPIATLPGETRFHYIAPEQTGRVTQGVDSRSDLYSVGILGYQLLCGTTPFEGAEPVELIYAHLARRPLPPHLADSTIPEAVSNIIMKLLMKQPEERYQTARALKHDLDECLTQLRTCGSIGVFELATRDAAAGFRVSQKLYGRNREVAELKTELGRAANGNVRLVLVSGAPGVGKSQLVRTIESDARGNGIFITGKFEQYKQNEPYFAIVQAFKSLFESLLAGSEESLRTLRRQLVSSLGINGQVIVEFIPELELIIGEQSRLQELPLAEKLNRLNHVFRNFVRVFAREGQTLCIFLDDLQWADSASLNLLKTILADPEMSHLLVIGAYRDQEIGDKNGFGYVDSVFRQSVTEITKIELSCLDIKAVTELLADTLRCSYDEAISLAKVVYQKTDGNPFFLNQFVAFLHHDRLIEYDHDTNCWKWNLRLIAELGITEDVLQLTAKRLLNLPPLTQEALQAAACLGSRFQLSEIGLIIEEPETKLLDALTAAEGAGLIIRNIDVDDSRLAPDGELSPRVSFRFLHDRVQQAAYALISPEKREGVRLRIGQALLRYFQSQGDVVPFNVVDNLNEGAKCLSAPKNLEEIARLNLAAGRRARELAAYDAALGYFRNGIRFLDTGSWSERYELSLQLHLECLECAYITGNVTEANTLFDEVLKHAQSKVEKAKAYYIKILLNSSLDRSDEAVAIGIEALKLFGEVLPVKPSRTRLLLELARVVVQLHGRRATALHQLRKMTDSERISAMNLLMSICPAAYFRNPDVMAMAALRIVSTSLKFGNASASSFGYVLYGLLREGLLADYEGGHQFGRLAVDLANREDNMIQRCKIMMIFAGFINYWRQPIDTSVDMLQTSFKLAVDCGDVQYANYSILQIIFLRMARGASLDDIYTECTRHQRFIDQSNDWFAIASHKIRKQAILALKNETLHGWLLSDVECDEQDLVSEFQTVGNLTVLSYYHIVKMQLDYLFGRYDEAFRHAETSDGQINSVLNQIVVAEHYFYYGLIVASLLKRGAPTKSLWSTLNRCRAKLKRFSANCPENFLSQSLTLDAEYAFLRGQQEKAAGLLDKASSEAQKTSFLHLVALANELAGANYFAIRRWQLAKTYMAAARKAYAQWGALAKVAQLIRSYADLFEEETKEQQKSVPALSPERDSRKDQLIDFDTIARAASAMSGELKADRLLIKLMRLLLESANAERVLFIAVQDGSLQVMAAGSSDGAQVRLVDLSQTKSGFSEKIVNYVLRTGSTLLLNDARFDSRFLSCPYVIEYQPRSVVCLPLMKQGAIIGATYVENRLASGVFTADRLQPLTMLSHQVIAVIENSRLQRLLVENSVSLRSAMQNIELLERVRSHLLKFVPHTLQKVIASNPTDLDLGTRNEDLSILFLDMAGYTKMSERLDSEELKVLVETYFSSFLDDIRDNGGDINEIAGDGLMLMFQDTDPKQHAKMAVRTALAVRDKTARLNQERVGKWPTVTINIGIHSGEALVGVNKIQSGSETRWIYTCIGYAANLAARVGASATNGAILVSDSTAKRVEADFELRLTGPQTFKGISHPIEIYSVVGMR